MENERLNWTLMSKQNLTLKLQVTDRFVNLKSFLWEFVNLKLTTEDDWTLIIIQC